MKMDQRVFDQIDGLGLQDPFARSDERMTEPTAEDEYGVLSCDGFVEQPFQMDSFDEQLLREPDYNSRHAQAALGHARLSLPPGRSYTGGRAPAQPTPSYAPEPSRSHSYGLSRYTFNSTQRSQASTSPNQPSFLPSPSRNTSHRRVPPPFEEDEGRDPGPSTQRWQSTAQESHPQRIRGSRRSLAGHNSAAASGSKSQPTSNSTSRVPNSGPPVIQGIQILSTRELPDRFRSIFSFPLLNPIQSKCFPVIYKTNDNFVLSSPTGSGKTAVLELAICHLINTQPNGSFKIVYMAPTKSLCAERQRDWGAKLAPLDLQCAELTGDTDSNNLRNVQNASVIITTPEKWDAMTRKWKDHLKLMQMVKLFLIDEVHLLREDRGATLEAVISRMKSIGSDVRFVALSATVPNSQDVATWLGKDSLNPGTPAPRERFGEEFRPVKLQKHVCGYQSNGNDYAFDQLLNTKLTDVVAKWSQRKPLMVFCMTRKSCSMTAKVLANWWKSSSPRDRFWDAPRARIVVSDDDLRETLLSGVAFHHAGLDSDQRTAVEKGYLSGDIGVICCTSTLAVGVNLPCHMVIMKSTVAYAGPNTVKEYSDLETMQMLGRAGRPQFDDSGVAVIMTRLHRVPFYENMISGQEVLESRLHLNLIEHLNAEIGLGTVTSAATAKKWLASTFLYVRLKSNPDHYKIEGDAPGLNIDERLDDLCKKGISMLEQNDLVRGTSRLQSTEYGDSMARYYIQFRTMQNFLALPAKAKISEILSVIAQAAEFKDIRFRAGEKTIYKDLNKNSSIKFPIPTNIDLPAHKTSLLIQSILGSIELPTDDVKHRTEFASNRATVYQHAHRLIRCIIDCQLYRDDSVSARNALMLARSIAAKVWDDSPLHMKQLDGLGIVYVRKLVAAGIRSIEDLGNTEASHIERALSRNPPFGSEIQKRAAAFPQLRVEMKIAGEPVIKKGESVTLKIQAEIGFLNDKTPDVFQRKSVYVCFLAETSDGRKVHFARISAKKLNNGQDILFTADLTSSSQTIRGLLMCDEIAGTQRAATLKPEIPTFWFPAPKTLEAARKQGHGGADEHDPPNRRLPTVRDLEPRDGDDFGDDARNVLADRNSFANIDDYDDHGNAKQKPRKKSTSPARVHSTDRPESIQLPNGKWTCYHNCKVKSTCKHECCREGTEKKPKAPKRKEKKTDPDSDLKQTQLDLIGTKKSTGSPHVVPNASTSVEARNLERLHSNVKSHTPKVPILSSQALPQRKPATQPDRTSFPDDHDSPDDFGLDTLSSDDFPTSPNLPFTDVAPRANMAPPPSANPIDLVEDDMLDTSEDPFPALRLEDNPSDDDWAHLDADALDLTDEAWHFDPLAPDTPPEHQSSVAPSSELNHHAALQDRGARPSRSAKSLFVTGDSTDSLDPVAVTHDGMSTPLAVRDVPPPKRPRDDGVMPAAASSFLVPAKKQKQGSADATESAPAREVDRTESVKDWFERTFGTEHFQFVG